MDWSATANNVSLSSKCQLLGCNMQIGTYRRQAGLRSINSLKVRLISFPEEIIFDQGNKTETLHVYVRPLSTRRWAGPRGPQIKRQDSGETERVANQARFLAGQGGQSASHIKATLAGETNHGNPISCAFLSEGIEEDEQKVAADIKHER